MSSKIRPIELTLKFPEFNQGFSSTPRGARLARLLGTHQLAVWGWPYDSKVSHTAGLLIAELCANAVLHGHQPNRDCHLRMTVEPHLITPAFLRIEVSDSRPTDRPGPPHNPGPNAETGRGLFLIDSLATRWGITHNHPTTKTIWCELDLPKEPADPAPPLRPTRHPANRNRPGTHTSAINPHGGSAQPSPPLT